VAHPRATRARCSIAAGEFPSPFVKGCVFAARAMHNEPRAPGPIVFGIAFRPFLLLTDSSSVMAKSKSYGGLIVLLLVVAAAAGGTWYYVKGQGDKAPEVTMVKVARGAITQAVTATGDLQPVVIVDVGAQVSGQIKEVLVDFNSKVKAGDVLARIDESTPTQRLRQAEADFESTKASNKLTKLNVDRTRELYEKKLVSQQELDSAEAQLSQSNATMLTREAAVNNAKLDLERTVITAPIDGIVLDRKTDKGRTVNSSMNAPTLFTLVNDLTKMQINAAVAEADIGLISEGQSVRFTVDAFPGQTFRGSVRQVRNAASANQSVVSYATIIDVANEDLKLKPGMTANVSIIVSERPDVLRVPNTAMRVRIPPELQSKLMLNPTAAPGAPGKADGKSDGKEAPVAASMTDDERRRASFEIMRDAGIERGTPPSPEQLEKVKKMAKDKGLDPDLVAASMSATRGGRGGGGGGGAGGGGAGGGGRGGRGGAGGAAGADRGFNNTEVVRQLYKVVDPAAKEKKIDTVRVRLGISDGIYTEVLDGLTEGDMLVTAVTLPGAAPVLQAPGGAAQNPFSGGGGNRGGMGGGGGGGGGGGMRGGR
jgi:HlyD family secretion protein